MRLVYDRDEKVVVTRGYLMAFGGMMMMLAGVGIDQGSFLPVWVGMTLLVLGAAVLILCFSHLLTPPQPLDQDRPEAQG